jgi:hypothetical protein
MISAFCGKVSVPFSVNPSASLREFCTTPLAMDLLKEPELEHKLAAEAIYPS